jgi:pimeloyl-ACP methyl ester carboxylesterase
VGLRLGGTLAALASSQLPSPVACLVLWDPVTNGRDYIREMQNEHRALLESDFEIRPPFWFRGDEVPGHGVGEVGHGAGEVLGFPLPAALSLELQGLDESSLSTVKADRVYLLTQQPVSETSRSKLPDARFVCRTTQPSVSWNSERSMNSALVPTGVLDMILQCLEEPK